MVIMKQGRAILRLHRNGDMKGLLGQVLLRGLMFGASGLESFLVIFFSLRTFPFSFLQNLRVQE